MKNDMPAKFAAVRKLFPHTDRVIYLNSASFGPFCTPVRDAITENVELRVAAEIDDSKLTFDTADELRKDYAGLLGVPKRCVGLGLNTTFGLNVAAFGLPLKRGDEILLSDVEFPAAPYTWRAAAEARGVRLKYLKSKDRHFDVEDFARHIGKRTRVLCLSSVQFFDGFKNDLKAIAEICRKHDLYFVVDGIQGMGAEPINPAKLDIDIFASGCQKWMLAPQGCGLFYLSGRVRDTITPPFMSWLGVDWKLQFSDLFYFDRQYFDSARRFEMGYYVTTNLLGMKAAVGLFQELGIANIQQHNHALIDRLADYIASNPFYRITSSMVSKHRSSIFTFTCDGFDELHQRLVSEKITLAKREGSIRVSVHLFNDETDIDRLIAMLDDFARR